MNFRKLKCIAKIKVCTTKEHHKRARGETIKFILRTLV